MANHLTELIETYGDAVESKEKYLSDDGDHELILVHYMSVCSELEEHFLSSLGCSVNLQPMPDGSNCTVSDVCNNAADRQASERNQP